MRKIVAAVTGVLVLTAGWTVSAQESAKPTSPKAKSSHEAMAKGSGAAVRESTPGAHESRSESPGTTRALGAPSSRCDRPCG